MVLIYIVSLLFIVGCLVYKHFTKYNSYWTDRNVAGPAPIFFFGNMKDSVLRRKLPGEVFAEIYSNYPREKVVGIYKMRTPALLVRDLDIVKNVLIKDFEVFADRGISFSDEGLGLNLFHADGDPWRLLRHRFTPLFTSGKLKNMLHLVDKCSVEFLKHVDMVTRLQREQEIHPLVQKYTQATIAACAFGVDLDTYNESSKQLERIDRLLFTNNYALELDWMYPGILKKIGSSLIPKEATEFFQNLTKTVIETRNGKPSGRNDFMDLILALRDKQIENRRLAGDKQMTMEMNDDAIAAQSFIFYTAGYETSASTMAFMLYRLTLNPDVQDNLVGEIDEVMAENNGELSLETLMGMRYLGQVIDETLRMHPLGHFLFRRAQDSYKIPGTNVVLEKDMSVIIPVGGISFDEEIYPNPKVFDPERFSPENVAARHLCAHLPFGQGPRNCLGMRFAQVQVRMCIAKLLSKFRLEPSKNTPTDFDLDPYRLIPYPAGGLRINFVPRT